VGVAGLPAKRQPWPIYLLAGFHFRRGLRSLGRSGNPLTEEEDGSSACSAKKGSERAISPSRFAVQGAPLVLSTQRRLVEEVKLPPVGKYT